MSAQTGNTFKRSGLAVAVAAVIAQPALSAGMLEEVTVTATRRAQTTTDVPYNISAQTGEALEKAGITDFTKLARSVPGLVFTESGPRDSGLNSGLIIRGLNVSGSGNTDLISYAAPTVSTYVGETPLFVNLHLKDIERVEILRGPQGTLYGSGSLGGTIRYIPKSPDFEEFYGEVSTRLGYTEHASGMNSDTYLTLNVPITDSFALRAVAGYVEDQGFIDQNSIVTLNEAGHIIAADGSDPIAEGRYPGLSFEDTSNLSGPFMAFPGNKFRPAFSSKSDANDSEIKHARVSAAWNVNDRVSTQLTYQRQKDDVGARQAVNRDNEYAGEWAYNGHILEELEREVELLALDLEADLGFADLSAHASHYKNDADYASDQTSIYVNQGFYTSAYYAHTPIDVQFGPYETRDKGDTVEIRLTSNGDGAFDYVLGAFWLKQEFSALQSDIQPGVYETLTDYFGSTVSSPEGFLPDQSFWQKVQPEFEDKAIFGELTWHISDAWQVTGGFRSFDQTFDIRNDLYLLGCGTYCDAVDIDPLSPLVGLGYNPSNSSQDFSDTIFKFNTSYDVGDDLMAYFTWAEGFRHGGANAIVENQDSPLADSLGLKEYDSDLATNWEVGLKGNVLDGRMNFTASLFLIEWEDMQVFTFTDGSGVPIVVNANEAESKGLELEATYAFTANFVSRVGLTYTDAELTKDFTTPGEALVGFKGDPLPGVPEITANLTLEYNHALENGWETAYRLNAAYIDEVETDFNAFAPNYTRSDSNTIVDISAVLYSDSWEVSLFVDNVTDEEALGNGRSPNFFAAFDYAGHDGTPFSPHSDNGFYLFEYIARPRTAGIGLKYRF